MSRLTKKLFFILLPIRIIRNIDSTVSLMNLFNTITWGRGYGFFFLFGALLNNSCTTSSNSKMVNNHSIINLDWLLGDWIRTNDEEGSTTYEIWNKNSDMLYTGIGVSIASNGDTIFREDLKIISMNDHWVFEVSGVNESPTPFTFQETEVQSFSVYNRKNEFPKFIKYWRDGSQLKAKVYNDNSNVIDFSFNKRDN